MQMGGVKEYLMHLHVGGKFVRDPYVRYVGGTLVSIREDPDTISYWEVKKIIQNHLCFNSIEIIYFHEPYSGRLQDNLRVLWDDTSTIAMLNYWEKFGFIDIYVEHKVDTPIFEEGILLLTDGVEVEVKDANVEVEGAGAGVEGVTEGANVEVEGATEDASVGVEGAGAGVEGATEGASVGVEGATEGASVEVEGAGAGGLRVEGVTKGANVEVEGVGVAVEGAPEGAGVGIEGAGEVECDNESENAYSINTEFLSDGEDDEELQVARVMRNCKQHREGTEVENNEGGDVEIEENTNEKDSDDYNIDENESCLASSDEEEDEATLRRKKIPKYNRNSESPQFCLGMLFTDGKEFKDATYKYSRCSRRELKIVKNEPKRISVKCIASAKCPWRIYASTNRQTRYIQVKTFINEHNCPMSFKNKMVSMKVIAEHFEDTIKDHPKMKIKEIQRRIQSELHVNVPNARCRRAKSLVTSRLAGSCKEEFALLWDYADELRTKNPGNDYLHSCYLKDTYIKAYSYALQPINGSHDWKKSGIEAVLPPIEREMPGRPKKNRRKAKDEPKKLKSGHISRTGLIMTCRNCGGEGHNKRSCPILKRTTNRQGTNKGLHTTLDSMEHNFHSGVTTRQSARTNVGVKRNVNSSSSSVAPKKKRKTTSESVREPVGTQESVAPKK
ncbi:hypothetical protein V6N11_046113 [Hibiscus sabdariffa]|uniref:CCHC-type domain-containing protein n=1 Tax=Hibiscus sabdariffa TaxID=183260 RepID=A0ABR1ZM96_9ROSI